MNAEELMIGNIVMVDCDYYKDVKGIPFKITGISERPPHPTIPNEKYSIQLEIADDEIGFINEVISTWSCWLQPIPITLDWLEKFGFKYNTKLDVYVLRESEFGSKYSFRLHKDDNGFFSLHIVYDKKIKFIHEIQNHLNINFGVKIQNK